VTALCGSVTSKVAKLSFGPPGDFNGDGDVDLDDFGLFQACLSGPGSITNDPACDPAKIDADEDVDYVDLYLFINCMSGAGITADPDCTR